MAVAAHAEFDLEVIVWVIVWVNVQGDSPPGRFDVERLSPAGIQRLWKHGVTNGLMIIYCCLYQSRPNNICSSELG